MHSAPMSLSYVPEDAKKDIEALNIGTTVRLSSFLPTYSLILVENKHFVNALLERHKSLG